MNKVIKSIYDKQDRLIYVEYEDGFWCRMVFVKNKPYWVIHTYSNNIKTYLDFHYDGQPEIKINMNYPKVEAVIIPEKNSQQKFLDIWNLIKKRFYKKKTLTEDI